MKKIYLTGCFLIFILTVVQVIREIFFAEKLTALPVSIRIPVTILLGLLVLLLWTGIYLILNKVIGKE